MKILFLLLSFLSLNAFAGSGSGNVSAVFNFGGPAITSTVANGVPPYISLPPGLLANAVTLIGTSSAPGAGGDFFGFYSASSPSSNTMYTVPAGKTLYVLGEYLQITTSTDFVQLGYSTASFTEGTASTPTGATYYGSNSTVQGPFIATVSAPAYTYFPVPMSFPAGSFPFWRPHSVESTQIIMIGYVQ